MKIASTCIEGLSCPEVDIRPGVSLVRAVTQLLAYVALLATFVYPNYLGKGTLIIHSDFFKTKPRQAIRSVTIFEKHEYANVKKQVAHLERSKKRAGEGYRYLSNSTAFGRIDLVRASEFDKREFERMILDATPLRLRTKLKKLLPETLALSIKYQMDPFWILAIMWTESHFIVRARSHVGAMGPMQIMPRTGHYLVEVMKNKDVEASHGVDFKKNPLSNIDMGIFYLRQLLEKFYYNYKLATVAYNMGPNWVRQRLRNRLGVGVKNRYLDRVREAYALISKNFSLALKKVPAAYKSTYVVKRKKVLPGRRAKKAAHNLVAFIAMVNPKPTKKMKVNLDSLVMGDRNGLTQI